jgi:alpha,alpha-trehalose phosphorylase
MNEIQVMNKGDYMSATSSYILEKSGFEKNNAELLLNETLFHNANGYQGIRGNFEEGYPEGFDSIRGQYINGFYNSYKISTEEWHIGFIQEKHSMVNVFDTQSMKLWIGEEPLDLFQGTVTEYKRLLDMKKGITVRSFVWESPKGKKVRIYIERLASFEMLPLFLINYRICPLNFSGTVKMESIQSGDVYNYFNKKDSRVAGEKRLHISVKTSEASEGIGLLVSETVNSHLEAACAATHICSEPAVMTQACKDKCIITAIEFSIKEGTWSSVEKYSVICDSLRYANVREKALDFLNQAIVLKASYWYQKQEQFLESFWSQCGIEIGGDEELNLSLHFNQYCLLQSAGLDGVSNIGAKGLSGEGYEGHYFWDTEMYMLPFFSLTQPDCAKKLLGYRYHILEQARENALRLGHSKGALFPWRTINGKECSYYYPSGGAQYHIIGDIAYGIIQYYLITGDWDYMTEQGAEIVLETARIWYDLGNFYKGKFHIHSVTGPDEYTCVVNNNYYTNLSAKYNLTWARKLYEQFKQKGQLETLQKKIGITEEEICGFAKAAEAMYLPYDKELDINPQDDSFLSKKWWDMDSIPEGAGPLMHKNFLYHIYRFQVCKQADTVLAHFLFEDEQKLSTIRNSFDYYERITTHDSSLSRCVFSIMAAKLGEKEKAYQYFDFSSKIDINNSQKNTKDGIHTANMGGTYMAIVYGFLGLRIKEDGFFLNPLLPDEWDSICLDICLRGSKIKICIDKKICRIALTNKKPVDLYIYGKEYHLRDEITIEMRK